MTLLTPLQLLAAAGIAVPILVHLFGRPRPRLVRFPSLMLLRAAQQQRNASTRLRRLVSLILRCLAILLLALMLSLPATDRAPLSLLGRPLGASAIVIDTSPSMGAEVGDDRPIDRARRAAAAIADTLGPGGVVVPATAGATLKPLAASAIPASEARGLLVSARLGDERVDIAGALQALSEAGEPPARAFVLTDMQATSVGRLPSHAGGVAQVVLIDVGAAMGGNSAIIDLQPEQVVHPRGRPVQLAATARTWGEGPGQVALTVEAAEETAGVGIELRADSLSLAQVELSAPASGLLVCQASLPPDKLRVDDKRLYAALVRDRLRVAVIGDAEETLFIRAALDPFAEGDQRSTMAVSPAGSIGGLPQAAWDAIIVADASALRPGDTQALAEVVRAGTGVLLLTTGPVSAEVLQVVGLSGVSLGEVTRREDGAALAELATDRPPLAAFARPGEGDLGAARFMRVPAVKVGSGDGVVVLARHDDGTPALLEGTTGRGRSLLFATAPDERWSDLVSLPEFPPLMHRLVLHLSAGAAQTIMAGAPGELTVGDLPDTARELVMIAEDGAEAAVPLEGGQWRFVPQTRGAWRVLSGGEEIAAFAVNLDPAESDPARMGANEAREALSPLATGVVAFDHLDEYLRRIGPGLTDLSSLVALLALLVLAVEAVQSLQSVGGQRAQDE